MMNVLKAAMMTPTRGGRWGLNLLLKGPPGSAKTAQIGDLAKAMGLYLACVIASLREPADFLGLAIPNEKGDRVHYAPPAWALAAAEAKHAVVFFDEMNTAPPAVQASLLRVTHEGVVGDLVLPPTVRFAAAINQTEESAGGWDLAAPLANRFGHLNWSGPDAEAWSDWLGGGVDEEIKAVGDAAKTEEKVLAAWPQPWAKARGLVASFIRRNAELLHKQPAVGHPDASGAWASRRTWECAARALASAEVHGLSALETETFVGAFVGQAAANTLWTWIAAQDLPEPADVLDGKVKFKHDHRRIDRTMVVLTSCASLIVPANADKRMDRAERLWTLMGEVAKDASDIVIPAAKILVHANPPLGHKVKAGAKVMTDEMHPVLRAVGMLK